jgi:hypothetical protein
LDHLAAAARHPRLIEHRRTTCLRQVTVTSPSSLRPLAFSVPAGADKAPCLTEFVTNLLPLACEPLRLRRCRTLECPRHQVQQIGLVQRSIGCRPNHNAKADFVGPGHRSGRSKGGLNAVAISPVNVRREVCERDGRRPGEAPQFKSSLVHSKAIVRQVP